MNFPENFELQQRMENEVIDGYDEALELEMEDCFADIFEARDPAYIQQEKVRRQRARCAGWPMSVT